ncbi:hypothetical protein PENANT_c086G00241 [Penicillium antarcticum]|uniref:Uncharacterized protein n=1 Tax=Penicillium antarcticum TaxID=416450 RepID=A0A1V6PMC6_9EURO|nr:hypothetical protein PENANT_c086G00241 [Penicillium antarcticum]
MTRLSLSAHDRCQESARRAVGKTLMVVPISPRHASPAWRRKPPRRDPNDHVVTGARDSPTPSKLVSAMPRDASTASVPA